jgi:nickel-dependent lactate racemase
VEPIISIDESLLGISSETADRAIESALTPYSGKIKRALVLPPDSTRAFSGIGRIAARVIKTLSEFCDVDVMPTLGTHAEMTADEVREMFGGAVDPDQLIYHNWREDTVKLGEIPGAFVNEATEGLFSDPIDVEINRRLLDPAYGLVVSPGQVVPHEVAGMANYSKNIFVGCGGPRMIQRTHLISAASGLRGVLGKADTPVRRLFHYAQERFLSGMPLMYMLTVNTEYEGSPRLNGLYIGMGRGLFEQAAEQSARLNIHHMPKAYHSVVTFMEPDSYKTTWVGNKAIYRTCMMIAPGGELTVLAPGVCGFGESEPVDKLIRKYGYRGTRETLEAMRTSADLADDEGAAAHMMNGSTDGLFTVTYAVERISREDIESVGFKSSSYTDACARLGIDPRSKPLEDGEYTDSEGNLFYYIGHPGAGLWMAD